MMMKRKMRRKKMRKMRMKTRTTMKRKTTKTTWRKRKRTTKWLQQVLRRRLKMTRQWVKN